MAFEEKHRLRLLLFAVAVLILFNRDSLVRGMIYAEGALEFETIFDTWGKTQTFNSTKYFINVTSKGTIIYVSRIVYVDRMRIWLCFQVV